MALTPSPPAPATQPGAEEVERLATAFNQCLEAFDAPEELFTPDVFFDLLPPFWRFQLQGPQAFANQLRAIADGPVTSRVIRVVPTAEGFLMEHEERRDGPHPERARRIWVCRVDAGRIAEATCYCNGGWDDELRARHAAAAPMIRP
jgi:ketosteroid isomerase-like protein